MADRIAEEELAHLERLFAGSSEHLARGHFGPADVAVRLVEAEEAVPRLVAEVRRLRDLIRRMADELEERQLSQPLWPEIYAALGLDWEQHVQALSEEARSDGW